MFSYSSQLATTGAGALVVFGYEVDQLALVGGSVAVVAVAAFAIRQLWRRGKTVNAR
jgi:phage tail tape-measure protein